MSSRGVTALAASAVLVVAGQVVQPTLAASSKKAPEAAGQEQRVPPGQAKKVTTQAPAAPAPAGSPTNNPGQTRKVGGPTGTVRSLKIDASSSGASAREVGGTSGSGAASPGPAAAAPGAAAPRTSPAGSPRGERRAAPRTGQRRAARRTERAAARLRQRRRAAARTRRRAAFGRADAVLRAPLTSSDIARVPPLFASLEAAAAALDGSTVRVQPADRKPAGDDERSESPVVHTVRQIVERVPGPLKVALAGLALLCAVLLGGYLIATVRSRRLARQRRELLDEVGLLQAALLPPVPERVGSVRASVAYRPSDGPGAGGDFYDAIALPHSRSGFVLGDVSGHGREALSHTAFMRYTLRAYLEAGLEPRAALRVAERVVGEHLGGSFATVILAVHDPSRGTLTYASAGHPAPIVVGAATHEPVPAAASPPIGWSLPTGLRQTTIPLPVGARALLYTDGLEEAPLEDGEMVGRERLTQIVEEGGPDVTATDVLDRVASEAKETRDDMAACLIAPAYGAAVDAPHTEQLELTGDDSDGELLTTFLEGCGVPSLEAERARAQFATRMGMGQGALVSVQFEEKGPRVEVSPRDAQGLEKASRGRAGLSSVGP